MTVSIFLFSAILRAVLWGSEELLGIDDQFHSDSAYYINAARALIAEDFAGWEDYALNNELYVVVAAILLQITDVVAILRLLNMLVGAAIPVVCFWLVTAAGCSRRTALLAAAFASLLPYQAHLSIHVLKDAAFILTGMILVLFTLQKKAISTLLAAALLISLRTYLGAIISIIAVLLLIAGIRPIVAGLLAGCASLALLFSDETALLFLARQETSFEGREFFANISWERPQDPLSLIAYAVLSPVKQLLLPSVFQAQSFADLAFGFHVLCYQALFVFSAFSIVQARRHIFSRLKENHQAQAVIVICVTMYAFSVSFIDLVVPALGPLVRYRELSFLLLAIACFVMIDYSRPRSVS